MAWLSTSALDINKDIQLGVSVSIGVTHVMQALTLLQQAGLLRSRYLGVSPSGCLAHGLLRLVFCFVPRTVTVPVTLKTTLEAKTDFQLPRDARWLINRSLPPRGELVAVVGKQFLFVLLLRLLVIAPVLVALLWWRLFRT